MAWKPDYVTTAEYGAWNRTPDTADDVEVALWITAASRAIEDHLHRQFGQYAVAAARVYRQPAAYDDEIGLWVLPIDDVQDTTGMTVAGTALASWLTAGGVLLPDNAPGESRPYEALGFTACPTSPVSVVAKFGWVAVPSQVKAACRLQVSRFMARRDTPLGTAGSAAEGSELRLQARVDADLAVALRGLGRSGWPR